MSVLWRGGLRDIEAIQHPAASSTDTAAWDRTNSPRAGITRQPGERRSIFVARQLAAYRATLE